MRCLVDTHALMWWWDDSDLLSATARRLMADPSNDVAVPTVCAWEISNKVRLGKLPQMEGHIDRYDALISRAGFRHADLRHDHALRAGLLPGEHRDPFDRLIAGIALTDQMTVITRDRAFVTFGCQTVW